MRETLDARLGVFAEAFGFGPASKACAIGRACRDALGVRLVPVGHSVAREYFEKEGLGRVIDWNILAGISEKITDAICREIDVALVVLQPEWACALVGRVPVVYVDSLGFMWDENFFGRYPRLREVDAYIAQDFLGAAAKLEKFGIRNLRATGALLSYDAGLPSANKSGKVVHLGGLANIFSESDGLNYARFALHLVEGLAYEVLTSAAAAASLVHKGFLFRCLKNADAVARFSSSELVYTSPGMTALLELAHVRANVVPLPPQNYSQALIVGAVSSYLPSNAVWRFLAEQYRVEANCPEELGVEKVRAMNSRNASLPHFRSGYRKLASAAHDASLPVELRADEDGLAQCVQVVKALI